MYIYYWLKKELQKPKALFIRIEREKERAGQRSPVSKTSPIAPLLSPHSHSISGHLQLGAEPKLRS